MSLGRLCEKGFPLSSISSDGAKNKCREENKHAAVAAGDRKRGSKP
jgi:hypothetical protein